MKREYDAFWTPERLKRQRRSGLLQSEVSILASIVEEGDGGIGRISIVAGLYINRLHAGIPLQADPTVKLSGGGFFFATYLI